MRRLFTSSALASLRANRLPPRPKINEEDIEETFIKGSGKGGQKINKTNSKVQLRHVPTGIVVDCQFSRSREDNRKKAREILALRVDSVLNGDNSREAIVTRFYQQKARKKKQRGRKSQRERTEQDNKDELLE